MRYYLQRLVVMVRAALPPGGPVFTPPGQAALRQRRPAGESTWLDIRPVPGVPAHGTYGVSKGCSGLSGPVPVPRKYFAMWRHPAF